jgi:hypothetical protein
MLVSSPGPPVQFFGSTWAGILIALGRYGKLCQTGPDRPSPNTVQEDRERHYSQIGYGKTTLVAGDGGDGENPRAMRIREDGMRRLVA